MQTSLLPFFPAWPVLLKNLEGLGVVMAMNVHGVLAVHDVLNVLAVHDVLKQGLILLGSLEKSLNVFLVSFFFFFFFFLSFTLETAIYDEQKCQVIRRFTAVTLPYFDKL